MNQWGDSLSEIVIERSSLPESRTNHGEVAVWPEAARASPGGSGQGEGREVTRVRRSGGACQPPMPEVMAQIWHQTAAGRLVFRGFGLPG